jgi:hypothetical protein
VSNRLEWLAHIPEKGRKWGQGITETATSLTAEIKSLEAQRSKIAEEIKKRYRLLRSLPARADREVLLMGFSVEEMEAAKAKVNGATDGADS